MADCNVATEGTVASISSKPATGMKKKATGPWMKRTTMKKDF
jgi:hypothetical protein